MTYIDGDGLEQFQRARLVAVAGNAIETPRLLLNSASSAVPRRAGELLRPGRAQLHAPPDRLGVRDLRQARAHVPRRDDGRAHRGRGAATTRRAASSAATTCSCSRSASRSWPRSWTRARGAASSPRRSRTYENMAGHVARRRGHAAGDQPGHAQPRRARPVRPARARTCTSTTTRTTSRCASTPGAAGEALYEAVGAIADLPDPAVPGDPQHRHGAHERAARGRRRQRVRPGARRPEPVRLRREPVHHRRRGQPDADDRRAGHPPGRVHRRAAAHRLDPDGARRLGRPRPGRLAARGGRARRGDTGAA